MSDAAITEYYVDRVRGTRVPLSQRIRPGCEAAPWVVEEVRTMEAELSEARAAIAELIEAVKEDREALQAYANNGKPENVRRYFAAEERLIAALARCNGGAA